MSIIFKQDFNAKNINLASAGWVAKGGGVPAINIILDPKDSNNYALSFKNVISAGDIFSPAITSPSGNFIVCGRYLSIDKAGADPRNSGGFVGYSWGNNAYSPSKLNSDHHWDVGTDGSSGAAAVLNDNREWNGFEFPIVKNGPIHLMLEDGVGVPGDAIFDDLVVIDPKGGGISSCSGYWSQLFSEKTKLEDEAKTANSEKAKVKAKVAAAKRAKVKAEARVVAAEEAKANAKARVEAAKKAKTKAEARAATTGQAITEIKVRIESMRQKHNWKPAAGWRDDYVGWEIHNAFFFITSAALVEQEKAENEAKIAAAEKEDAEIEVKEAIAEQANAEVEAEEAATERVRTEAEVKAAVEEQIKIAAIEKTILQAEEIEVGEEDDQTKSEVEAREAALILKRLDQGKKNLDNEMKVREKETAELREENRKLKEELVQHNSILQHYQEQLSAFQKINKKQDDVLKQYDSALVQLQQQIKVMEQYNIICPFIIASALIIGAEKGPNLLTGAAIGALSGAAACVLMHSYDVMPKFVGDTKPKVHQQPPEEDL